MARTVVGTSVGPSIQPSWLNATNGHREGATRHSIAVAEAGSPRGPPVIQFEPPAVAPRKCPFIEVADIGVGSAATGHGAAETQFERVIDGTAPVRVAATPGRSLRERLRRPLMLVVPIVVAVIGAAVYLATEPYVSTDNAFVRAAKVTVNARVAGQAVEIAVQDNQQVRRARSCSGSIRSPTRLRSIKRTRISAAHASKSKR